MFAIAEILGSFKKKPARITLTSSDIVEYHRGLGRGQMLRPVAALYVDSYILLVAAVLLAISTLMVFSSTAAISGGSLLAQPVPMLKRHLASIILGLFLVLIVLRLNPSYYFRFAPLAFVFCAMFLLAVLIPGIGHRAGGAQRWLSLGPLRLQPAEFCKLATVLLLAWYIEQEGVRMRGFLRGIVVPATVLILTGAMLLLQPDFGTTAVLFCIVICQLFLVVRLSHLFTVATIGAGVLGVLVYCSPYRFRRFVSFLDPFADPSSAGYQLIQSLVAVGSGGVFGEGLGAGKQKLYYLPAAHTDFIFAVIAEELGMVGALLVLSLFLVLGIRGLAIAERLRSNHFLSSLAIGLTAMLVVPALLNMGVVLGLLPTKGLVLPLVAYGGSAMLVHLLALGILLNLSRLELV